ncbi:hypothetical protein KXS11_17435 [Plantibacter flavus]|uniref:hypothetical protein n=1 Tax=Plantibacter flavus TaxID=150123 RepID=UPI003F13F47E
MNRNVKKSAALAVCAAALTVPLVTGAAAQPGSETMASSGTRTLTCTAHSGTGVGTGTAEVSWYTAGSDRIVTVERYRITYDGAPHGNSANINLGLNNGSSTWSYSPDSMKQDGQWHDLDLRGVQASTHTATVEFIFDASVGSDPRCFASVAVS